MATAKKTAPKTQPEQEQQEQQEQPLITVNKAGDKLLSDMADRLLKVDGLASFGIITALNNFTKLEK